VQCTGLALVVWTRHNDGAVLATSHFNWSGNYVLKGSLGALDGHERTADRYVYTSRNRNRKLTDT
jgi:hypothetical protein